ncbi:MAG: putative ABC transporter permease subunit [Gemmataceae bacterium]
MTAPPAPSVQATPVRVNQSALFRNLRFQIARNAWREIRLQSLVRPLTILFCSLLVVFFVFVLSLGGFHFFLNVMKIPANGLILEMVIGILFFSLGGLLIFSGGLILHGSLFNAAETAFLLSKPVDSDHVFAYKFHGAIGFSSWAFLLLGGPILVAYGMICGSPWYYYLFLPLFFLGFVLLPGSLGAIACLLLVNFVPKRRKQILTLIVLILGLLAAWWIYNTAMENRRLVRSAEPISEAATQLLNRISFSRSLWLPSAWVSRGLLASSRGDLASTGYFLGLVWSNGLLLYLFSAWIARHLYRRGFNRLSTGGDLRKKHGGNWMDRIVQRCVPFLDSRTGLLIVKDFRTFRRDPQQFGQVILFTGILILYFTNIKKLFIRDIEWSFQNGISMLNLCSISMLLSAYTGRFIYPLLSLEGRKFWILGLLPLDRSQLIWGKFAFSLAGGALLSCSLILLSDWMIEMPFQAILIHLMTVFVISAVCSGISVGLGAAMPNFKESDPSKIAVGLGGTVNLLVGLGFLCLIVGTMAAPWHMFMATVRNPDEMTSPYMLPVVLLGLLAGLIIGAMAVVFFLRLGLQALLRMEF